MPTNRVRIKRAVRSRVTDEARAIFIEALKLQAIYHDCISKDICRSTSVGEHCSDCSKYKDLSRALDRAVGFNICETSPLDADTESPPDYMRHNELQAGYWHKAWAMRCELEK